jgi:hypothetical protein
LEQYLFELNHLADYFQVGKLKALVMKGMKEYLNMDTVESFLLNLKNIVDPSVKEVLVRFVADNFDKLLVESFLFHKIGRTMLCRVLRRMTENENKDLKYVNRVVTNIKKKEELPNKHIGDPSQHIAYTLFKERKFSDYQVRINYKPFHVHKCMLFSESPFFQRKYEENYGLGVNISIVKENIQFETVFEILLIFLYTGLMTHENLQKYCFGLFWLSHKFEEKRLKDLCLKLLSYKSLLINC